jgi:hypothetical protein
MNSIELAASAAVDSSPPGGLTPALKAMWFAKAGKWDAAHDLCQDIPGTAGSWIHAYLHREEGDLSNAAYWYSRAGKPTPASSVTLDQEWHAIATALSSDSSA